MTKILENPKFFFSYAKRFAKSKSNVGSLLNNGNLSNDPQEMANILKEQYKSVFSDPSDNLKVISNPTPQASATIEDFSFTPADIEAAIDEIDKNASSTDHEIPAVVLKEYKSLLSYPIFLIWKTSFSSGVIPSDRKPNLQKRGQVRCIQLSTDITHIPPDKNIRESHQEIIGWSSWNKKPFITKPARL